MKGLLLIIILFCASLCKAQNQLDTIFMKNGDTLLCKILSHSGKGFLVVADIQGEVVQKEIKYEEIRMFELASSVKNYKVGSVVRVAPEELRANISSLRRDVNKAGGLVMAGSIFILLGYVVGLNLMLFYMPNNGLKGLVYGLEAQGIGVGIGYSLIIAGVNKFRIAGK